MNFISLPFAFGLIIILMVYISVRSTHIFLKENSLILKGLVAIALGVMLSIASLHLLPKSTQSEISSFIFLFSLIFFIVLFWLTHGHSHSHDDDHDHGVSTHKVPVFLGQAIHSTTDGIAIALSFLSGFIPGVVVSAAIAMHHVPMMNGIAERIRSKTNTKKVTLIVTIASSFILLGVIFVKYFDGLVKAEYFAAVAAASFIFVALSDFVVHLNEESSKKVKFVIIICAILGVALGVVSEELMHHVVE